MVIRQRVKSGEYNAKQMAEGGRQSAQR